MRLTTKAPQIAGFSFVSMAIEERTASAKNGPRGSNWLTDWPTISVSAAPFSTGSRGTDVRGRGNGPIVALVDALVAQTGTPLRVLDYTSTR
jgi:hypothetical protein